MKLNSKAPSIPLCQIASKDLKPLFGKEGNGEIYSSNFWHHTTVYIAPQVVIRVGRINIIGNRSILIFRYCEYFLRRRFTALR